MFSKQRLYEGENLTDFRELIERYHERYAQKTAFRFKKSPKDTQIISISYEDFYQDIRSLATSLLELGLRKKRIAIIAPNRYEWCTSYLAITASDIVVVPFDKALPENELIQLLERSKADAIFFSSKCGRNKAIAAKAAAGVLIITVFYFVFVLLYTAGVLMVIGADGAGCP